MRYEVHPMSIYEHEARLQEAVFASDDPSAAKSYAEAHAYDSPDGMAIVDTVDRTVDTGADVVPLASFSA